MYMCSITLLEIALAMLANCNEQRHKQFIAFDAAISKGPQLAEQQQSVCRQAPASHGLLTLPTAARLPVI